MNNCSDSVRFPGRRIKLLACCVFYRPLMTIAPSLSYALDMDFTGKFLHENPAFLGKVLQKKILELSSHRYDAVILGYGMCGNAIAGLRAGEIPLVIPRVHDCVSMFLGSHARYLEEFTREPGTFWYIPEYLESSDSESATSRGWGSPLAVAGAVRKPISDGASSEEHSCYLQEVMSSWKRRYRRAVYLESGDHPRQELRDEVRRESLRNNWEFVVMKGSLRLFAKLLNGPWDEEFLVLQPGERIPSFLAPEY